MDRGSQLSKDDEDDEEEEERRTRQEEAEEEKEEEKEEEDEEATDIKSNNPHLAGGELQIRILKTCCHLPLLTKVPIIICSRSSFSSAPASEPWPPVIHP